MEISIRGTYYHANVAKIYLTSKHMGQRVFACVCMYFYIMEALGSIYNVKWGISSFVGTSRCSIS